MCLNLKPSKFAIYSQIFLRNFICCSSSNCNKSNNYNVNFNNTNINNLVNGDSLNNSKNYDYESSETNITNVNLLSWTSDSNDSDIIKIKTENSFKKELFKIRYKMPMKKMVIDY